MSLIDELGLQGFAIFSMPYCLTRECTNNERFLLEGNREDIYSK